MVDTPKEDNGDAIKDPIEDKLLEKQSKRQRQWRRSKSCHGKNSDIGTRENSTSDDAEDNEDPAKPSFKQAGKEDGRASPDEQAVNDDSEDSNYMPLSEDEVSLDDKEFIMPEDPVELERFKRRLIATARSYRA